MEEVIYDNGYRLAKVILAKQHDMMLKYYVSIPRERQASGV